MFGLMRVKTHEQILHRQQLLHEDIINDLAYHLWEASDLKTKRFLAQVAPEAIDGRRPTLRSLNPTAQLARRRY